MSISPDIREWCDESDVDGNACDELRELADRIDREMMELPKDADGETIRIGDVVYGNPCIAWTVVGLRVSKFGWKVEMDNMPFLCEPDYLSHKKPEPADSWEKLEEDVNLGIDDYWTDVLGREYTFCTGDKVTAKASDIIRRAKKLAGIEEGGAE